MRGVHSYADKDGIPCIMCCSILVFDLHTMSNIQFEHDLYDAIVGDLYACSSVAEVDECIGPLRRINSTMP